MTSYSTKAQFFQGLIFLILAQMMVGVNIVATKFLLGAVPMWDLLAIRFLLATLILLLMHQLSSASRMNLRSYLRSLSRFDWTYLLAQALTAGVLFNSLMFLGLHYTDANVAGIITSALPTLIAIFSWLILGEKLTGKMLLCIALASMGLTIIAWGKLNDMGGRHSLLGDSLVLLSLIPEAAYYVICKMHVIRLPVFLISALVNGINTLIILPIVLWMQEGMALPNAFSLGVLIVLGTSSGLFYVFWYFGCQWVEGTLASLTTAVMPVATVILAWFCLNEQLTMGQGIGMGLVMGSILMYTYARR